MKQLKHLEWVANHPVKQDGYWKVFWPGAPADRPKYQGHVTRVRPGMYEARPFGGRAIYGSTMHDVARRLVANINGIYPCQLPR